MDFSDQQLIVNYFKGDEKSLEILIKRYLQPIYNFVYRRLGNEKEAEDITQEIFIKAWRNLKKSTLSLSKGFDPKKGSFKTWIFTIAKNTCIDWQKKKRTISFSELEGLENKIGDDKLFESAAISQSLESALKKLIPKYRLILSLRYNNGFNFREIAESLGEPLNTIKSRHYRALIILKKLIGKS